MFQLRSDQLDAFAEPAFARRIAQLLRNNLPTELRAIPEVFLSRIARHAIAVARTYHLVTEREIGTFALQMLRINPDFHQQPALHAILMRPPRPGVDRLELLLAEAGDDDWNAAAHMTDAGAYWGRVMADEASDASASGRLP